MQKIKNIIFDLGGIFIEIDFLKTENAFKNLGVVNWGEFYTQHSASTLFENLETGKISPVEFYENFRQQTALDVTNQQIKNAWNAMLGNFPLERLQWLKNIKQKYNIYLFSNTNIIHYEAFQKIFQKCSGETNFDDYFIKAYYSHDLGLRKPYPESFQRILELENLKADETLFIDDTAKNVEGAQKAGLQTILLLPPKTLLDLDL